MNTFYSVAGNTFLFFLSFFLKDTPVYLRHCFFVLPFLLNVSFQWYLGLGTEWSINGIFLLFWVMFFFLDRHGIKEKAFGGNSPLFLFVPVLLSLFNHNYIFINAILLLLLTILFKYGKKVKYSYLLIFLTILGQFLSLDFFMLGLYGFDDLMLSEAFVNEEVSLLILIIPLSVFIIATMEEEDAFVRSFLKLVFAIVIMKFSIFITTSPASIVFSYVAIFLTIITLSTFKKIDITLHLFALSFAFMVDEGGSKLLPPYLLGAVIVGEGINMFMEKRIVAMKFIGGILLLPFVNPFVTRIFSHLQDVYFALAFVFVLFYTKLLTSIFKDKGLR